MDVRSWRERSAGVDFVERFGGGSDGGSRWSEVRLFKKMEMREVDWTEGEGLKVTLQGYLQRQVKKRCFLTQYSVLNQLL